MISTPKPHNTQKYYEFHKQRGHKTAKYRELRKALYALADKGQINRFLKGCPRFLEEERKPVRSEPRDEECFMEIVATITGGYSESITRSTWKAQQLSLIHI